MGPPRVRYVLVPWVFYTTLVRVATPPLNIILASSFDRGPRIATGSARYAFKSVSDYLLHGWVASPLS